MSKRLADAAALEERLAALQGEEWESGSDDDENDERFGPSKTQADTIALLVRSLRVPPPPLTQINLLFCLAFFHFFSVIPLSKKSTEAAVVDKSEGKRDKKKKVANDGAGMSSVVYVGHVPHGFYEEQMRGFFSQFGDVERVRLSRSKKTGGSKGYAFIEFKDAADTKIVAESMDKYLLAGKQLVVKQLPVAKLHKNMWKGADEKFRIFPLRKQHAERVNKVMRRELGIGTERLPFIYRFIIPQIITGQNSCGAKKCQCPVGGAREQEAQEACRPWHRV